jgi:hypothetical protein
MDEAYHRPANCFNNALCATSSWKDWSWITGRAETYAAGLSGTTIYGVYEGTVNGVPVLFLTTDKGWVTVPYSFGMGNAAASLVQPMPEFRLQGTTAAFEVDTSGGLSLESNFGRAPWPSRVVDDPEQYTGHESMGTGWCVALPRELTDLPAASLWFEGEAVGPDTPPGTVIATFQDGQYTNRTNGDSHAAILINVNATSIAVIEQYRNDSGSFRSSVYLGTYNYGGGPQYFQNAANYRVVRYYP